MKAKIKLVVVIEVEPFEEISKLDFLNVEVPGMEKYLVEKIKTSVSAGDWNYGTSVKKVKVF